MAAAEQLLQATADTLRLHAPFDGMEADALRFLAGRVRLAYFAKDAEIAGPGQGIVTRLHIVKQGVVQGSPTVAMRSEKLVDLVHGPGECFPIGALLGRRETAYRYVAQGDVFTYELAEADFQELLGRSARFQRFCTDYLASLVAQSQRALRAQVADTLADESRMVAPLRQLVAREPVACGPEVPIRIVLQMMHAQRIGSMIVVDGQRVPIGIFTHPDLLERVALAGKDVSEPIASVMTPNPIVLDAEAPIYAAALAMAQHGIRHVVLASDAKLTGVISERDLFAMQRVSLRRAAERIRGVHEISALAEAAYDVRQLSGSLLAQGMNAEQLTQIITALNDSLVQRAVELAARHHRIEGRYCWLALGSEGRMEQTLATDQDNALIIEEGGDVARYLAFADEVNRALDACGFPLCKGDIMARNAKWCLTLGEWRETFTHWVQSPIPEALLNAAIFFDFRALAGEPEFAGALRDWLLVQTAANPAFLRAVTTNALQAKPPLGLWRDFVTDDSPEFPGTLDLKKLGVRPFVDVARVWSLAHRLPQTGTTERLRAAARAGVLPVDEAGSATEAFHFIQTLRLRHQHFDRPAAGTENRIRPDALNSLDRRILKEAFRHAAKLQERVRLDYQL